MFYSFACKRLFSRGMVRKRDIGLFRGRKYSGLSDGGVNKSTQPEKSSFTQTCDVCRSIKFALRQPHQNGMFEPDVRFEPADKILKNPCTGHESLAQYILQSSQNHEGYDGGTPDLWCIDITDRELHINFSDGSEIVKGMLLLAAPDSTPSTESKLGRILDPDWVDIDLLREWISECVTEHDGVCDDPFQLGKVSPAWLIDTVDNCLVPGNDKHDYITLSYRWGKGTHLQTHLNIVDMLQQPGALLKPQFAGLLSPTLKHCIGLARLLGERYVWADALCIVQDDGEQTAAQLRLMGAIYASAKFAVVQIDGDANHGIPGLKGVSQPRRLVQEKHRLGADDHVVVRDNPVLHNIRDDSLYFSRAWTFQEYFLSRRRLVIGNNQFHWSCTSKIQHEDIHGSEEHPGAKLNRTGLDKTLSGIPDLEELEVIAQEYNGRDFTFPEDALAGASGFLAIMNRAFEGGLIYGLPEMCFDFALMWTEYGTSPTQRRFHSGRDHAILEGSQLPSWSWLGWKTSWILLDQDNRKELYDNHNRPIFKRITQWYTQETPKSSTRRAIRSYLFDDPPEFPSIKDWTKEPFDPSRTRDRGLPHVLGEYVYKHPRRPNKAFWRPFPVQDVTGNNRSAENSPSQHPYLSCTTKRGWFAAQNFPKRGDGWEYPNVSLYGKNNVHCGYLRLPSTEDSHKFPADESGEFRSIELVAVCLKRNPKWVHGGGEIEWDSMSDLIEATTFDEQYGVLWVEWVDGVAYRKGVGYVDKENWDSHDLEDVDLVLG